jgi:hypothetical protein
VGVYLHLCVIRVEFRILVGKFLGMVGLWWILVDSGIRCVSLKDSREILVKHFVGFCIRLFLLGSL